MSEQKKGELDSETILMTLDQIGQTIEIMTNVVGRLRSYVSEQATPKNDKNSPSKNADFDSVINCPKQSQTLH